MKKKIIVGISSARSIELRREFFFVTNHPPPDDLHLLCKYIVFSALGRMVGGAHCGPCVHATNSAPARNTTVQAHTRPTRHARHMHRSRRSTDDLPQQHVPGCRGWRIGWPQMPERLTTTAPCRRRRRKERSRTRTHHVRPQARLVLCQLASHTLRTTTCEWIVQSTVLSSAHELSDRQGRPSVE